MCSMRMTTTTEMKLRLLLDWYYNFTNLNCVLQVIAVNVLYANVGYTQFIGAELTHDYKNSIAFWFFRMKKQQNEFF